MAMTLRLSDEDTQALHEAAQHEGRSMQEIAVTAVHQYLVARDEFRRQQVARFLQEDAELLELLAK